MPLGSSSAAPLINPGPSAFHTLLATFLIACTPVATLSAESGVRQINSLRQDRSAAEQTAVAVRDRGAEVGTDCGFPKKSKIRRRNSVHSAIPAEQSCPAR